MGINPLHLGHRPANRKRFMNIELCLHGMVSKRRPSQKQAQNQPGAADQWSAVFMTHHTRLPGFLDARIAVFVARKWLAFILTLCLGSVQRITPQGTGSVCQARGSSRTGTLACPRF